MVFYYSLCGCLKMFVHFENLTWLCIYIFINYKVFENICQDIQIINYSSISIRSYYDRYWNCLQINQRVSWESLKYMKTWPDWDFIPLKKKRKKKEEACIAFGFVVSVFFFFWFCIAVFVDLLVFGIRLSGCWLRSMLLIFHIIPYHGGSSGFCSCLLWPMSCSQASRWWLAWAFKSMLLGMWIGAERENTISTMINLKLGKSNFVILGLNNILSFHTSTNKILGDSWTSRMLKYKES